MQLALDPRAGQAAAVLTQLDAIAVAHATRVPTHKAQSAARVQLAHAAFESAVGPRASQLGAVGLGEDAATVRRVVEPRHVQPAHCTITFVVVAGLVHVQCAHAAPPAVVHPALEARALA